MEAHKDLRLLPENTRLSYLILRVMDSCDVAAIHNKHGASKASLEAKLRRLDDTQATAIMVWAAAFWVSRSCDADNLDDYIKQY